MSNTGTIKDRLLLFIKAIKSNKGRFEKSAGLANGFLNDTNTIRSDKLALILEKNPQLDMYWLITGQGNMFREVGGTDEACPDREERDVLLYNRLREMKDKIERLIRVAGENEKARKDCVIPQKREDD